MNVNQVILLIIDDVRYDQFFSLIDSGSLPNLEKLKENSLWGKSITTFPSVTLPAHLTIMTGLYQDSYFIPFMHWYSRNTGRIRNYSKNVQSFEIYKEIGSVKTIYEMLEGNTTRYRHSPCGNKPGFL